MSRLFPLLLIAAHAFGQDPLKALEAAGHMPVPQAWPIVLEADVELGSWSAAERVGDAANAEIDAGRLFPRLSDVPDEVKFRRAYALALDHAGRPADAREQRCLADSGPACATKTAAQQTRRLATLKTDLLATQLNQPAAPLLALDGHRGQIVIAAFWATWCAPCLKELEELKGYNHPGATVIPVDIDRLSTDAKLSYIHLESLDSPEVPQLYVIDRAGNIRFHLSGFDNDGLFRRKLDWMIEALLE